MLMNIAGNSMRMVSAWTVIDSTSSTPTANVNWETLNAKSTPMVFALNAHHTISATTVFALLILKAAKSKRIISYALPATVDTPSIMEFVMSILLSWTGTQSIWTSLMMILKKKPINQNQSSASSSLIALILSKLLRLAQHKSSLAVLQSMELNSKSTALEPMDGRLSVNLKAHSSVLKLQIFKPSMPSMSAA